MQLQIPRGWAEWKRFNNAYLHISGQHMVFLSEISDGWNYKYLKEEPCKDLKLSSHLVTEDIDFQTKEEALDYAFARMNIVHENIRGTIEHM